MNSLFICLFLSFAEIRLLSIFLVIWSVRGFLNNRRRSRVAKLVARLLLLAWTLTTINVFLVSFKYNVVVIGVLIEIFLLAWRQISAYFLLGVDRLMMAVYCSIKLFLWWLLVILWLIGMLKKCLVLGVHPFLQFIYLFICEVATVLGNRLRMTTHEPFWEDFLFLLHVLL